MSIEPNQLELTIGLIGGLALFLFGMEIMTRAQAGGGSVAANDPGAHDGKQVP